MSQNTGGELESALECTSLRNKRNGITALLFAASAQGQRSVFGCFHDFAFARTFVVDAH